MRLRSVVSFAAASILAACTSSSPGGESPAPQDAADLLRVGESVTGTLDDSDATWGDHGRFDAYRFQANAGDTVLIRLSSENFDPYLVVGTESAGVFDPLEQNDDFGDDLNPRIRFVVPRTGTYRILAQAYTDYGGGTYELTLEPYVPDVVESTALGIGASVDGYLDQEDNYAEEEDVRYDEYVFQAQAGRRYSVTMISEDFDAYLVLGTGSGDEFQEISRNDDSGEGTDSRIVHTPETSGAYTVRATSYDGASTGSYTIRLGEIASGPPVVRPLAIGRAVSGTLDEGDQIDDDGSFYDVYSFSGRQGDRVEIAMRSATIDSYLEVGEPAVAGDEFFAQYSDDDGGENVDSRLRITLPRTGEYHVRAMSLYPDETGDYTITLTEAARQPPASARPIRVGQTVEGTLDEGDPVLDDGSFYELYTFEGRAGQDIRVTLRSTDFDAYLQFGEWDGENIDVMFSDDDNGGGAEGLDSMLELTLPGNRTYAIMANSVYGEEEGDFTLSVEQN